MTNFELSKQRWEMKKIYNKNFCGQDALKIG